MHGWQTLGTLSAAPETRPVQSSWQGLSNDTLHELMLPVLRGNHGHHSGSVLRWHRAIWTRHLQNDVLMVLVADSLK
jgi:hypothetical protein